MNEPSMKERSTNHQSVRERIINYVRAGYAVLDGIVESAALKPMTGDGREHVIDAARGLTTIEAENAFALAVVESKGIDPAVVGREKAQTVKKNGLLEWIETKGQVRHHRSGGEEDEKDGGVSFRQGVSVALAPFL